MLGTKQQCLRLPQSKAPFFLQRGQLRVWQPMRKGSRKFPKQQFRSFLELRTHDGRCVHL